MSSRGHVARLVRALVPRAPHGLPCPQGPHLPNSTLLTSHLNPPLSNPSIHNPTLVNHTSLHSHLPSSHLTSHTPNPSQASEFLARSAVRAQHSPSVGPNVAGGAHREFQRVAFQEEPPCVLPGASWQGPGASLQGARADMTGVTSSPSHSSSLGHRMHSASLSGPTLSPPGLGVFSRGLRTAPRRMRIVLRAYLPGLGRPGDVVSVSPGYARNLLIPYKLAFPALDKYIVAVQAAREQGAFGSEEELAALGSEDPKLPAGGAEGAPGAGGGAEGAAGSGGGSGSGGEVAVGLSHEDRVREAEDVAERLDARKVSLRRITPRRSDQLRQAVSAEDIIAEVQRQLGVALTPKNIVLPAPLQKIGLYDIPLVLPKDVTLPGGKEQITLKVNVRRK